MNPADNPFLPFGPGLPAEVSLAEPVPEPLAPPPIPAPALARLHGFDLLEQPLLAGLAACPGELVLARSTVPLRQAHVGREVLVLFVGGDARAPVIVGVIEPHPLARAAAGELPAAPASASSVAPEVAPEVASVLADGERHVIQAEREVVLRCGDASITLTRAGKVLIRGHYILSRATGYNKIKGAAIDIN